MHEITRTLHTIEVTIGATGMMMAGMGDMRCRMCM